MKKLILTILLLSPACLRVMAQNTIEHPVESQKVRLGIAGGLNLASYSVNKSDVNNKKSVISGHAGIYADVPLLPGIYLQPGVMLSGKGGSYTVGDPEGNDYTTISSRPIYLEIPLNLVLKMRLPNKVRLIVGAGPYVAFGVAGKNEISGKILGIGFSNTDNIEFGSDDQSGNDMRRSDIGLNALAGMEINHLTLTAGYGYGFTNVRAGSGNNDYENRVISVSIGMLF